MRKSRRKLRSRLAYMCGVAWQHEVGETGVKVFSSPASCASEQRCTKECGIVEVKVSLSRWVRPQRKEDL